MLSHQTRSWDSATTPMPAVLLVCQPTDWHCVPPALPAQCIAVQCITASTAENSTIASSHLAPPFILAQVWMLPPSDGLRQSPQSAACDGTGGCRGWVVQGLGGAGAGGAGAGQGRGWVVQPHHMHHFVGGFSRSTDGSRALPRLPGPWEEGLPPCPGRRLGVQRRLWSSAGVRGACGELCWGQGCLW